MLVKFATILCWAAAGTAIQGQESVPPASRAENGDGQSWRQRWREIRDASPEERREMRLDWMLSMVSRNYELDQAQQEAARKELQNLRTEYYAKLGPRAAEMDEARDQMRSYWMKRMEAREMGVDLPRPSDDPEFEAIRGKLRTSMRQNPFDWPTALERIERMLPPEQAARGRERRQAWLSRREDRFERWQTRATANHQDDTPPGTSDELEAYTRDFIGRYGLDGAQTRSAHAILNDVRQRYRAMLRSQEEIRQQLEAVESDGEQIKALDEPLRGLFDELKRRLDSLLTEKQRAGRS